MGKTAIVTDSNSGITQAEAKELGITVIAMPFHIQGTDFYEDVNLTQAQFYELLEQGGDISTSMPAVGDVTDLWDRLCKNTTRLCTSRCRRGLAVPVRPHICWRSLMTGVYRS